MEYFLTSKHVNSSDQYCYIATLVANYSISNTIVLDIP